MEMYQEIILDHYKNPRNSGEISDADFIGEDVNPLCGDKVKVFLKIKDDVVVDMKHVGEGCAISRAATSMLSEEIIGKSLEDVGKISNENIFEMLGVPISPARVKCALLGVSAVRMGKGECASREIRNEK